MPTDLQRLRMGGEIKTPMPTEGHVLYGPDHYIPGRDHTYSARPAANGLHKLLTGRRRPRPCTCRIVQGTRFYCEPCSRYGLEHLPLFGVVDGTPDGQPTDRGDATGRTAVAVGKGVGGLRGGRG